MKGMAKAQRLGRFLTLCIGVVATTVVAAAAADPPKGLRLYVLDCGTIRTTLPEIMGVTRKQAGGDLSMSDPCYLIRHPKGLLLFDTGQGDNESIQVPGYKFEVPHTLLSQLSGLGINPDQIRFVAISLDLAP
jgi:hypothetical protein